MPIEVRTPLAVSSFFQYVEGKEGPGARGGGFIPDSRLITQVMYGPRRVMINGREERDTTTEKALSLFFTDNPPELDISVEHRSPLPIGAGFGTSGSGSLGAVIGTSLLLRRSGDYYKLASYAHKAEIMKGTGLGTVASITSMPCGAGLLVEPGPPGMAKLLPIVFEEEGYSLLLVVFGPKSTRAVLSSEERLRRVSQAGRRALEAVERDMNVETLLKASRRFAEESGIVEKYLLRFSDRLVAMGALGATPNMIGNGVHALVPKGEVEKLEKTVRNEFPKAFIKTTGFGKGGVTVKLLR
jgi:pantoate kinase